MSNVNSTNNVYCPLLKRTIDNGYCWELCNIAENEILLNGDVIEDWDAAQEVCRECGLFEG